MTFKRRVLIAFAVMCLVTTTGSAILSVTDAPESLHQVLIGVVGAPFTLYLVHAIMRERDELEQNGS